MPAHHEKTALQQFQAKHCLVSTAIAKMALFWEQYHDVAKQLTNAVSWWRKKIQAFNSKLTGETLITILSEQGTSSTTTKFQLQAVGVRRKKCLFGPSLKPCIPQTWHTATQQVNPSEPFFWHCAVLEKHKPVVSVDHEIYMAKPTNKAHFKHKCLFTQSFHLFN